MGKVVMTLLVSKDKKETSGWECAVQMTYPALDRCTGKETMEVSVRILNDEGEQTGQGHASNIYRPQHWKAAEPGKQAEWGLLHKRIPTPWFPYEDSLFDNIYDFPGSGDESTNNKQNWEIDEGSVIARWRDEGEKRLRFREEKRQRMKAQRERRAAERSRRIAEWREADEI